MSPGLEGGFFTTESPGKPRPQPDTIFLDLSSQASTTKAKTDKWDYIEHIETCMCVCLHVYAYILLMEQQTSKQKAY